MSKLVSLSDGVVKILDGIRKVNKCSYSEAVATFLPPDIDMKNMSIVTVTVQQIQKQESLKEESNDV